MESKGKVVITVQALVKAPIDQVWKLWTSPEHIIHWNSASDDWHTPRAENDLRVGGRFLSRMEAKNGSMGFDFEGIYEVVKEHELIVYSMADGRKVSVTFHYQENETSITESFDAEQVNSVELQRSGWQSILNNFKVYAENHVI